MSFFKRIFIVSVVLIYMNPARALYGPSALYNFLWPKESKKECSHILNESLPFSAAAAASSGVNGLIVSSALNYCEQLRKKMKSNENKSEFVLSSKKLIRDMFLAKLREKYKEYSAQDFSFTNEEGEDEIAASLCVPEKLTKVIKVNIGKCGGIEGGSSNSKEIENFILTETKKIFHSIPTGPGETRRKKKPRYSDITGDELVLLKDYLAFLEVKESKYHIKKQREIIEDTIIRRGQIRLGGRNDSHQHLGILGIIMELRQIKKMKENKSGNEKGEAFRVKTMDDLNSEMSILFISKKGKNKKDVESPDDFNFDSFFDLKETAQRCDDFVHFIKDTCNKIEKLDMDKNIKIAEVIDLGLLENTDTDAIPEKSNENVFKKELLDYKKCRQPEVIGNDSFSNGRRKKSMNEIKLFLDNQLKENSSGGPDSERNSLAKEVENDINERKKSNYNKGWLSYAKDKKSLEGLEGGGSSVSGGIGSVANDKNLSDSDQNEDIQFSSNSNPNDTFVSDIKEETQIVSDKMKKNINGNEELSKSFRGLQKEIESLKKSRDKIASKIKSTDQDGKDGDINGKEVLMKDLAEAEKKLLNKTNRLSKLKEDIEKNNEEYKKLQNLNGSKNDRLSDNIVGENNRARFVNLGGGGRAPRSIRRKTPSVFIPALPSGRAYDKRGTSSLGKPLYKLDQKTSDNKSLLLNLDKGEVYAQIAGTNIQYGGKGLGGKDYFIAGSIDDLKLYGKAFSSEEVYFEINGQIVRVQYDKEGNLTIINRNVKVANNIPVDRPQPQEKSEVGRRRLAEMLEQVDDVKTYYSISTKAKN